MDVLTLNGITKYYGKICALNNVSFSVPEGSVFGILGPNGSGKTTMLGIVMDILKPSSGSFLLLGKPSSENMRRHIGTLLETPNFYHYLSGEKNLRIAAEIKGKGLNQIDDVLHKVNLYNRKDSKFSTYSLGMKQRLAIAAALLGDPDVLVFDEPTNGLDPVGIAEIRELIKKLALDGKTIIMASHMLDEVEKVCTHVAILKMSNLITAGKVDEVLVNEDIIEVGAANMNALELALNTFSGHSGIKKQRDFFQILFAKGTADLEKVNAHCFANGVVLTHLMVKKKSLETKFLELTHK